MTETIDTARVADITGFSVRWVQIHAARGTIPSAVQLVDGGEWRFDEGAVRLWKQSKTKRERLEAWRPSIKEAKRGGGGSSIKAKRSANLLKQRLGL